MDWRIVYIYTCKFTHPFNLCKVLYVDLNPFLVYPKTTHRWHLQLLCLPRGNLRITVLTFIPKVCTEISHFYDYFPIALVCQ